MRESKIEKDSCDYVRERGGIPYKFTSPARVNVPDRLHALPRGISVFIEYKATGKEPSAGQYREMQRLIDLGHHVYWTDNIELSNFIIDFYLIGG